MRLGDLDALKDRLKKLLKTEPSSIYGCGLRLAIEEIDNAPTVEAFTVDEVEEIRQATMEQVRISCKRNERPHGKWEYNQYDGNPNIGNWHCSECRHIVFGGYSQKPYYNFCPNCGADKRGDKE